MAGHSALREAAEGCLVLLDACCLINLYGSGRVEEIMETLPFQLATSELIADTEILTIRGQARADGSRERIPVSLRDLEASGHLSILPVVSDREVAEFVRFALHLDDGEASVCALAVLYGGTVATDDRKALRILKAEDIPAVGTPELLFTWAKRSGALESEVRNALHMIRDRAHFYPRSTSSHFEWWNRFFA